MSSNGAIDVRATEIARVARYCQPFLTSMRGIGEWWKRGRKISSQKDREAEIGQSGA
jgi:hypothetical protein